MDFKFPFILLVIGVGVAGVTPFVMSQVQEDAFMEIDMLETQVEKPFRIQNASDINIFSIDTYGVIEGENGWVDVYWKQPEGILTLTDNNSTKITLAQWNFNPRYAEIAFDYTVNRDSVVFGQTNLINVGGSGTCFFRAEYTDDDFATWQTYGMELQRGGYGWDSGYDFWFSDTITNNGIEAVRLVMWQNTPTGECQFRGLTFSYGVIDSELYDIVRVV